MKWPRSSHGTLRLRFLQLQGRVRRLDRMPFGPQVGNLPHESIGAYRLLRYKWFVRCFVAGLILFSVVCGETLQYLTVDRPVVEQRLRAAGSTNEQRQQIVRD